MAWLEEVHLVYVLGGDLGGGDNFSHSMVGGRAFGGGGAGVWT